MDIGKIVLITGASGDIGHAIAERFLQEGYRVILHANTRFDAIRQYAINEQKRGREAYAVQADLLSDASIDRMCDTIRKEFGSVYALVNNAGIALPQRLITEYTSDDWDRVFALNVRAPFFLSRAFLPGMIEKGEGCIVNISSIWGVSGGACETIYSSSKAALIGLTKSLAKEVGPSGVRVNGIAPGWIETGMNAHLSEDEKKAFCMETALNGTGSAEDVANAALFLASENASYVTGQVLAVDGGYLI